MIGLGVQEGAHLPGVRRAEDDGAAGFATSGPASGPEISTSIPSGASLR